MGLAILVAILAVFMKLRQLESHEGRLAQTERLLTGLLTQSPVIAYYLRLTKGHSKDKVIYTDNSGRAWRLGEVLGLSDAEKLKLPMDKPDLWSAFQRELMEKKTP